MNGFIDIRDDQGLLLFRYHPILGAVEVLVHRYDRITRKHVKEPRTVILPPPPVVVVEAETVDSEAVDVV